VKKRIGAPTLRDQTICAEPEQRHMRDGSESTKKFTRLCLTDLDPIRG
jgi:hypothetical protein